MSDANPDPDPDLDRLQNYADDHKKSMAFITYFFSLFRSVGWEPGTSSSRAVSSAPFGTSLLGTKCFADFFSLKEKTDVWPNRWPFTEEVTNFRTCGITELVTGRVLRLVRQHLRGTGMYPSLGWVDESAKFDAF